MFPDKSTGPDGMNPCFFQHFWSIVGPDVVCFCSGLFNEGRVPKEAIMLDMGFAERWVNLIIQCVSTVEYFIPFDKTLIDPIRPKRGIRQGILYHHVYLFWLPKDLVHCLYTRSLRGTLLEWQLLGKLQRDV
ncbi:unnamed protein product [Cuscuta europaea]|uniref:Uncharacterized protein n=1 Tax=Cuscuta europaea TaxID=41803 RepID=A0A9P0ZZD1_CUSEU|nr:unnamed protein product [Cuscuta europaea]